eukprot:TRINITY_DN45543_c0_g1_i1.p1 TRINITY_DN45543_c0_g1~~TRINITY_DN45543_c0_g1_i1.p1  ORF type:complete len:655 (-),score=107.13 TRINITY_DN45543_c0_g1_i1:8-1948(-)
MADPDALGVEPPAGLCVFGDSVSSSSSSRPEWEVLTAGGYRWVRQLGRGQYGTAHLVSPSPGREVEVEGEQAVAKVVILDHLKDRDRALALQEVEVLRRLQHPNVVRHHLSWLHRGGSSPNGAEALVNIMEYCAGGDLRDWLDQFSKNGQHLPEESVLSLFAQMLRGVLYIHSCHILHRDLKTSNMLLDESRQVVKIGDFGIARVLESTAAVAATMLGTPYYMSPEVCKGEPYREKSDMWSLGCVLYEMCVLRHAFESQSLLGLVYCIVSEHYDPIPGDRYGPALAELVAKLLAKSADERPSAEEALALPSLQAFEAGSQCLAATCPVLKMVEEDPTPAPPPPPISPPRQAGGAGMTHVSPQPPPSPWHPGQAHSPPPGARSIAEIPMPDLGRRPAPPNNARCQRTLSGQQPPPPPPSEPSAPRTPTASAGGFGAHGPYATSSKGGRMFGGQSPSPGGLGASARPVPRTPFQSDLSWDAQVLLSRARGALLRRPRAKGNWVQAFARHDTTGLGELSRDQFSAFLQSLSLGLSSQEVELLANQLLAERPGLSLFVFGEAIEHASPGEERFGEAWAADLASQLAGLAPQGLAAYQDVSGAEALAHLPESVEADAAQRFLLWLPKQFSGAVDWTAAEEWRVFAKSDRRR